ncbi:MAG: transcriptional regulator [Xanthomonadales bacterium]|nr:transcriptional regulator [Xanthomonadales bacterium]
MEAVERALEDENGCADVLQRIAGVRGALNGLMAEVVEDHIQEHVADAELTTEQRSEGAAELIDVVRAYLK